MTKIYSGDEAKIITDFIDYYCDGNLTVLQKDMENFLNDNTEQISTPVAIPEPEYDYQEGG